MKTIKVEVLVVIFGIGTGLGQTFTYVEGGSADLSDNYLSPTTLTVGQGSNTIMGSLSGFGNDRDFFELIIPAGLTVNAINLLAFEGGNNGSYLMLAPGTTLPKQPGAITAADVGFSILGAGGVGTNVLPTLSPAIPTLAPFFGATELGPGSYAGWLNETGNSSTYTLEFVAVPDSIPEPSSVLLLAVASFGFLRRKR